VAITVTVASASVTPRSGTLTIEQTFGARHLCSFEWIDPGGGGVHPAIGDAVEVLDGATVIFGGLVSTITERGWAETSLVDLVRSVTATDWAAVADQRIVTRTWAAGTTLKTVLQNLITEYLGAFSITLDGAQATGATMPALVYANQTLTDVLNDLTTRTGWAWRISYAKVFGMYAAGTTTAPFSITTTSGTAVDLSWTQSRDSYYNRLYVLYGPSGSLDVQDTWTATASQVAFALHYTGIAGYQTVSENGTWWPVGVYGVDAMRWTYDPAGNALHYDGAALAGGEVILFRIGVPFPQTTYAEVAAHATDPWEAVVTAADCTDYLSAQALATARLAQYAADVKRVTFTTTTAGLEVGQLLTITLPGRHLASTHLVTRVVATHDQDSAQTMRYAVECVSGDYAQATFLDTYRLWSGGGAATGQAGGISTVAGGVGGAADGSSGVYAGAATYASAPWRVSPEGKMVAGSWTFASAPTAAVASSGATDVMRILEGATEKVKLDWDSTALYRITVAGGSVFTFGPGLKVGAPTGGDKGAGTINAVGVYDDGVLLANYTPSGYTGSLQVSMADASTRTLSFVDGLLTAVNTP
jgi:hypothetical protein